jgi:endonuclease-3
MPARPPSAQERASRAAVITQRLRRLYPHTKCALDHTGPLELLVATILSAQCTDKKVNEVTIPLFKKYRSAQDFARARQEELEGYVHQTGFFRNKAKNIIAACALICSRFGGRVPDTMEELTSLPGVARKTANIVLANAFGKACGIAVDVHVKRLAGRLGLSAQSDPDKIEQDLLAIVPRRDWLDFNHLLVDHGRAVCMARTPRCPACALRDLCPSCLAAPKPAAKKKSASA